MSTTPPATTIGLDVGGTKLLAVCRNAHGEILEEVRGPTRRELGRDAVLQRCAELVRPLRDRHAAKALGIGFAGLVDADRGITRSSIMVPGFDAFPLAEHCERVLALPTRVDNDANTAALAELSTCSRQGLHMVLLTVGTGIGGAIVIDGRLYRGAGGLAGELGNTTLAWQGERCWCGNRGCANILASGTALARAGAAGDGPGGAEAVVARARAGDPVARAALDHTTRALGALVANVINTFNPHRVAIAGGLSGLDGFVAAVRAEAATRAFAEAFEAVEIAPARHGDRASAVGAAILVEEALA